MSNEEVLQFDVPGIMKCQRNRYPMLFVDRITECVPLKYAKGYKLFSYDEWYFHGYDIPSPKVWTVVQLEAMSQVFLMTFLSKESNRGKIAVSNQFDKLRMLRKIEPGDRLDIEATLDSYKRGVAKGRVVGTVNGKPTCSVECTIVVPEDMVLMSKPSTAALFNTDYKLPESKINFGVEEIKKCMLNKYPWLFLDKVIDIEPGKNIHALKNFTYNESFFPTHFEGEPSVPGFIQIETCMQAFLLTFLSLDEYKRMETADTHLDNIRVRRKVIPGDAFEIKATLSMFKRGIAKGRVESFVNGEPACSFDVVACIPAVLESFSPKPRLKENDAKG
jgi:3-hydroxyacyl-[acyl-carrier-protein] dehydratase